MLRYDRQTKPGLVALYDIRPGNRAGPFLQPRSPHGAVCSMITVSVAMCCEYCAQTSQSMGSIRSRWVSIEHFFNFVDPCVVILSQRDSDTGLNENLCRRGPIHNSLNGLKSVQFCPLHRPPGSLRVYLRIFR